MCPYLLSSFISQDLSLFSELVSACLDLPVCLSTFVCLRTCQVWSALLFYMLVHWWEHWTCRAIRPLIVFVLHPSLLLLPIHLRGLFFLQPLQNLSFWFSEPKYVYQLCFSPCFCPTNLTCFFVILYRDISPYISIDLFHVRCNSVEAFFAQSYLYPKSSPAWIFLLCLPLSHLSLSTCQCPNLDLTFWSPHMLVALGFGRAHGVKSTVSDSDLLCTAVAWALGRRHTVRLALRSNLRPLFLFARHSMTQPSPLAPNSLCLYVYLQHVGAAGYEVFS